MSRFYFLHTPSSKSWELADPTKWCLEHADEPSLERARNRLLQLTDADSDRIIRLVTRRCNLNLIEVLAERIVVSYWGQQGPADLRPFFKAHGLTGKETSVLLCERKHEVILAKIGNDFLFGEKLADNFPLNAFSQKWDQREIEEADDRSAAPGTRSGYAWDGGEDNRIPWAALKSAWRRTAPFTCLNCDKPTILTNFGNPQCSMFNRSPRFIHVCGICRRSFRDELVKNVEEWMTANLDAEVLPEFKVFWGRRTKREWTKLSSCGT